MATWDDLIIPFNGVDPGSSEELRIAIDFCKQTDLAIWPEIYAMECLGSRGSIRNSFLLGIDRLESSQCPGEVLTSLHFRFQTLLRICRDEYQSKYSLSDIEELSIESIPKILGSSLNGCKAAKFALAAQMATISSSKLSKSIASQYSKIASEPFRAKQRPLAKDIIALLAGPGKTGTTSLANWLEANTSIVPYPNKELSFLELHSSMGIDWYDSHFISDKGKGLVWLDASPSSLGCIDRLELLASAKSEIRSIIVVRHPLEQLASMLQHDIGLGILSKSILELAANDPFCSTLIPYYESMRVDVFVDAWKSWLGNDRVMLVPFSGINSCMPRVCEFLDLPVNYPSSPLPHSNISSSGVCKEVQGVVSSAITAQHCKDVVSWFDSLAF